jgi:hypothetical protein
MRPSTRTAVVLLMFAQGLAGCGGPGLPSAPSPVPQPVTQPNPQPPPNLGLYTVTVSSNTVSPGSQLSVSWTASTGQTKDWIGLYIVGALDCEEHLWGQFTNGATSGTFTLTAPTRPGEYELRYYPYYPPHNSCVDYVRSSPVTVRAGG